MNRMELIRRILDKRDNLKACDVEAGVGLILKEMKSILAQGGRIEIRGFGSFATTVHRARLARNPKTGERIDVPQKLVPRFRPGKELRNVKKAGKALHRALVEEETRRAA